MAARESGALQAVKNKLENQVEELTWRLQLKKRMRATSTISEERRKQALDSESKLIQLKTSMQRLEEKVLDMEFENKILRKQTLVDPPIKKMWEHLLTPDTKEQQLIALVKKLGTEFESKLMRSMVECQCENVDALINCAITIYTLQQLPFTHVS